jgi:4-aminobutyrate aminotransferase-like enzyme
MRNLRGKGLLLGFDLVGMDGQRISAEAFNVRAMSNGAVFYAGSKGGNLPDHLLVAPPLTIDRTDADELIDVLHQTLSEYCAPDDLS